MAPFSSSRSASAISTIIDARASSHFLDSCAPALAQFDSKPRAPQVIRQILGRLHLPLAACRSSTHTPYNTIQDAVAPSAVPHEIRIIVGTPYTSRLLMQQLAALHLSTGCTGAPLPDLWANFKVLPASQSQGYPNYQVLEPLN